jgi:hypothetical protein
MKLLNTETGNSGSSSENREMDTSIDNARPETALGAGRALVLWILFFLISFGLGYPTLNRYDARELGPDWVSYYNMVLHQDGPNDIPFGYRVLVPEIARPFYLIAKGKVGSWNPVFFGLLMSNCLFCATAAFLFLLVGLRVLHDLPIALLGCTLYLLNWVVPNLFLSGLVDSSEACLMMAITWAMFSRRWWLLPLIGIPGGFAKQSFMLFSTFFAATWWFTSKKADRTYPQGFFVVALGGASAASVVLAHRIVAGATISPLAMAAWWGCEGSCTVAILKEFTDQEFWYAFGWLLPLGVIRLNRLPKPWVAASIATALLTLGLGGYAGSLGNVCRPVFSVIGPVLTLSVATLLAGGRSGNWGSRTTIKS